MLGHLRQNEEMMKLVWDQEDSPMSKISYVLETPCNANEIHLHCAIQVPALSTPILLPSGARTSRGNFATAQGKGQEYPPHWVGHSGYAMTKM